MSADFAADQNAWGVVPAPLAPTAGAPPYADANEEIQQVLEAVKRNLPAVFAPPKKKAKKGKVIPVKFVLATEDFDEGTPITKSATARIKIK